MKTEQSTLNIKKEARISDMTSGDPKMLILKFMLPMIGGNILQQMITVVDAAIVGQGVGVDALAAVGSTDWIYWFLLWAAAGFGQGFSVIIATTFGEKNIEKLKKSINMALGMSVVLGFCLAAAGILLAEPALRLLNTPENIFEYAHTYVSIMYGGIFIVAIYNTLGSILRSLGDSSSPFIALVIATIMNICLDGLFVMVFHWGVAGAAIASVISQTTACLYCFRIFRQVFVLKSTKEDWKIDKGLVWNLWNKGVATAFQYAIIAIGGVIVQFGLNSMGFLYVAGFTATNKLYGILEGLSLAMGSAMMVYVGQNYGAGNKDRIKQGVRISCYFGIAISIVIGVIMVAFGKSILMLFIDADSNVSGDVLEIAYKYLFNMSMFLFVLYIVNTYRNIVMALNKMTIVVLGSSVEFTARVIMTILVLTVIGVEGVFWIEVTAWTCAALILFIAYCVVIRKLKFNENEERR